MLFKINNYLLQKKLKNTNLFIQQIAKMNTYLINSDKYLFLKELGISELNFGVFDGNKWKSNGKVVSK